MHTYAYMYIYVPGSLYAICRVPPNIDGLCGWRMRSQAYKTHVHACVSSSCSISSSSSILQIVSKLLFFSFPKILARTS
ncbi:hypothetical protein D8674_031472 [Pyrus ussuriensis x Pyrus communis]|uniref:Uncharacterized protein n=1 Tax=Pyrus ussuriensis x Pyrus communis TaxID=2448454 RepID=A0A5N5F429_9ROSA|nr:hypothetical protein D8674_031472 [Pyrus ussuriensis x Pyrus communis]